jgi:hypothetical protein
MDMSEIGRTEQADSIHAAPREAYTLLQNMETLVESRRCDEEQIELCDMSPIHSYTEMWEGMREGRNISTLRTSRQVKLSGLASHKGSKLVLGTNPHCAR